MYHVGRRGWAHQACADRLLAEQHIGYKGALVGKLPDHFLGTHCLYCDGIR